MFAEFLIYLNLSWLLVNDYLLRLTAFIGVSQEAWFAPGNFVEAIARGEGEAPYRGRILVPWFVIGIGKIDDSTSNILTLAHVQRLFYILCMVALMFSVRFMITAYGYAKSVGFSGALLLAGLLSVALRDHGYQAWSWFEAVTFAIAVILTLRFPSITLFAFLCALAALNRETALFLPLIPLAVGLSRWRIPPAANTANFSLRPALA